MGRVLWLADVLRDAGLTVVENPGWKHRGVEGLSPLYQLFHHTASSRRGGLHPCSRLVVDGRRDLPGPLCNVLVWRDGTCEVIASGVANHAGRGTPLSNRSSVGWECENDGVGEPWPGQQLDAIAVGMAAVCRHTDRPASTVYGHKETALPKGRKIDPTGIDMDAWRSRVAALLSQEDDDMTDEERMVLADLWVRALYARKQASGWPGRVSDADVQYWVNIIATRKGTFGGVAEVIAKA